MLLSFTSMLLLSTKTPEGHWHWVQHHNTVWQSGVPVCCMTDRASKKPIPFQHAQNVQCLSSRQALLTICPTPSVAVGYNCHINKIQKHSLLADHLVAVLQSSWLCAAQCCFLSASCFLSPKKMCRTKLMLHVQSSCIANICNNNDIHSTLTRFRMLQISETQFPHLKCELYVTCIMFLLADEIHFKTALNDRFCHCCSHLIWQNSEFKLFTYVCLGCMQMQHKCFFFCFGQACFNVGLNRKLMNFEKNIATMCQDSWRWVSVMQRAWAVRLLSLKLLVKLYQTVLGGWESKRSFLSAWVLCVSNSFFPWERRCGTTAWPINAGVLVGAQCCLAQQSHDVPALVLAPPVRLL